MAKEDPKAEAAPSDAKPASAGKRGKFLTFGIFGGIMIVEGVAIFMAVKIMGHEPDPTVGLEGLTPTTKPWEESQELSVAQVRVPNNNGARAVLYSVKVVVRVHHSHRDKAKEFLENRKNTVEDVIGRVIRSAEDKQLAEPGLETLKRQLRYELNQLIGDEETFEQVLVPECVPLPTGL